MNAVQIVEKIKETKQCSFAYLAEKIGKKRASNVSEMLRGKDMWAGNLYKLVDAMDYEIVIQPKKGLKGEKFVVVYTEEE
jgi:hypothetical protein